MRRLYPSRALILGLVSALGVAGCAFLAAEPRLPIIEFVRRFRQAEARPSIAAFTIDLHTLGGIMRAGIAAPVPGRIIWTTPLPRHAGLRLFVGLPSSDVLSTVRFRIGISDNRIYESLAERTVTVEPHAPGEWTQLEIDLSRYAGRKWSIFYQPDIAIWRLGFSSDLVSGAPHAALWGEPAIETDVAAARHFYRTRLSYTGPRARP